MAFDYGSIDLGIKNPFKKEGLINTLGGLVVTGLGIYLFLSAANSVHNDLISGWILALFGLSLLVHGIYTITTGIIAMLRYFVGRNHPTSLAKNHSESQQETSIQEEKYVYYKDDQLREMLMGRKNVTFKEPVGILARLLHSVFPRLTFMPYMIRNLAQYLFSAWVKTLAIFVIYALVAFVTLAGFAGETGRQIFPIYSFIVVIHLLKTWQTTGTKIGIQRNVEYAIESLSVKDIAKTIGGAIIIPAFIGLILNSVMGLFHITDAGFQRLSNALPAVHPAWYMLGVCVAGLIVSATNILMLRKRLNYSDPTVEVSELRENWQESVHPREIFINLDNLVMANRRYKEVPNRVYKMLDPQLIEQVEGKGAFKGEMTQEVQPRFMAMALGQSFSLTRLCSVISGRVLYVIAAILVVCLAHETVSAYVALKHLGGMHFSQLSHRTLIALANNHWQPILHLILSGLFVRAFSTILSHSGHLFFSEMQFESNLFYLKIEGTFTESTISTGNSIHDSTRSENVLVRSSITPWIIVSRIVTSTFASSGMRNLEYPRYIMEMHKNDAELKTIRDDMVGFLKNRESIASITSERDLRNASQIYEINQQSRATTHDDSSPVTRETLDNPAGYLHRQAENNDDGNS